MVRGPQGGCPFIILLCHFQDSLHDAPVAGEGEIKGCDRAQRGLSGCGEGNLALAVLLVLSVAVLLSELADVSRDFHGAERRSTHGAEVCCFSSFGW